MKLLNIYRLVVVFLFFSASLAGQESFWAPAEKTGSITVKLYPTEVVSVADSTLVTFGVPFTKGSITHDELQTIRVLKNNSEIPSLVKALTPWRNPVTGDTLFVRIALIQFEYSFTNIHPEYEEVTVEWGMVDRSQTRLAFVNPKTAWHLVEEGTFTVADNIYEPDVYAVLPREVLSKGVLKTTRMSPFHAEITEARDDAYKINYDGMTGGMVHESASKNFLYSIINEDTPPSLLAPDQICDYKNNYEPWLFDRSATMYVTYFRSGFIKPLREAVRASQFYKQKIYSDTVDCPKCTGFFSLKMDKDYNWPDGNNSMYSYNENLAYTYWLTGDTDMLEYMPWIVKAQSYSEEPRWGPENRVFTERHIAFEMLANTIAYEVLGKIEYFNRAMKIQNDLIWHQNGADGQIPSDRLNGALWHYGRQHGDWPANTFGASPWMSAILIDASLRNYAVTGSEAIATFIYKFGEFFMEASTLTKTAFGGGKRYPMYTCLIDGSSGPNLNESTDPYHAVDVGVSLAWAYYFSQVLGENNVKMQLMAKEFYETYKLVVKYFTRPAGPATGKTQYRVTPWRRYNWEHRISGSYPWLIFGRQDVGTGIRKQMGHVNDVLEQNYPNPVSTSTAIKFHVSENQLYNLSVYDLSGNLVALLLNEEKPPGTYTIYWDGTNSAGKKISDGIYLYQLKSNKGISKTRKLIVGN